MKTNVKKIVAMVMAVVLAFSLASCSVGDKVRSYFNEEADTTVTEPIVNKTQRPNTIASIVEYYNKVSNNVKNNTPGCEMNKEVKIPDGSFKCENEKLEAALPIIKNYVLQEKSSDSSEFGSDITDKFPVAGEKYASQLNVSMVKKAMCYQDSDYYIIKITLQDDENPANGIGIGTVFTIPNRAEILEEMKKASDKFTVDDYTTLYTGCTIECKVNRGTDEIVYTTYARNVEVTATVTGVNTFADIGTVPVQFKVEQKETYNLTWEAPTTAVESENK